MFKILDSKASAIRLLKCCSVQLLPTSGHWRSTGIRSCVRLVDDFTLKKQNKTDNEKLMIKYGLVSFPMFNSNKMLKTDCPARIVPMPCCAPLWKSARLSGLCFEATAILSMADWRSCCGCQRKRKLFFLITVKLKLCNKRIYSDVTG